MIEVIVLCSAIAASICASGTPVGGWLRRYMVDRPARWLNDLTLAKAASGLFVFVVLAGFALGAPEMIALFGATELTLYLEVIALALLSGARNYRIHIVKLVGRALARLAAGPIGPRLRGPVGRRSSRQQVAPSEDPEDDVGDEALVGAHVVPRLSAFAPRPALAA